MNSTISLDFSEMEIDAAITESKNAFKTYRNSSLAERASLLQQIAISIEKQAATLIETAAAETHLSTARLRTELTRTIFQLNSYAAHCVSGQWLDVRINTADPNRNPPKPDIRKILIPLGPVAVFGASNFPFAYSTAGGDTASAFAAGCSIVVKAHPAHIQTSRLVAAIIEKSIDDCGLPPGIFKHIEGASNAVGECIVKHPSIAAVGFTGSLSGGRQLFNWGNERKIPIPVFAEMGSINPVFVLAEKMQQEGQSVAKSIAGSITLSMGQFCTNPGIILLENNPSLNDFLEHLKTAFNDFAPTQMLHEGIAHSYREKQSLAQQQEGVSVLTAILSEDSTLQINPSLLITDAVSFMQNDLLKQEVFGPFSILVVCNNKDQMIEVAQTMEGQLTATIIGTANELSQSRGLINTIQQFAGRIIFNGVPTGVEVCLAMQHGGPYPASTDSRFTAVGGDAIRRFARPVCYQNCADEFLPPELQNSNPLDIWRTVNDIPGKDKIINR